MKLEKRTFDTTDLALETRDDQPPKIRGHAAVFDRVAGESWFREKVAPGAFADSLQIDDIRALWNHDTNFVLGRNRASTLKLWEDDKGLAVEITPPETELVRDMVMATIGRGDVSQMSFGFQVLKQTWVEEEDEDDLRIIEKVKLWEVSPVTFPFYEDTDVALNSHREWRASLTPPVDRRYKNHNYRRRLDLKLRQTTWR